MAPRGDALAGRCSVPIRCASQEVATKANPDALATELRGHVEAPVGVEPTTFESNDLRAGPYNAMGADAGARGQCCY